MRELILHAIVAITDGKKLNHINPAAATYPEIVNVLQRHVKEELNQLIKDGILSWSRTLNSISFQIKDNDNSN